MRCTLPASGTFRSVLIVLSGLLFFLPYAQAQISTYTFSTSSVSYTEITGGTVLGSAANDEEKFTGLPIGFSFVYRDSICTTFSAAVNGFLRIGNGTFGVGDGTARDLHPIDATGGSSPGNFNFVIAPLDMDLRGIPSTGELRYETVGTAPDRELVLQWKNYREYYGSGDNFNFQVRLKEGANTVTIVYGSFTVTSSYTPQVGIRGTSNADFSTRTSPASDWSTSSAGINTSKTTLSNTTKPASGTAYVWTPAAQTYSSSTTVQPLLTSIAKGSTDQAVIALKVTMTGSGAAVPVTSVSFSTNGSTDPADISAAKLYYTGSSSTFSTSTMLGSSIPSPSGAFTFNGFSQLLTGGDNYLWLAYDIASGATAGDVADAECSSVTVNGSPYTPTVQAPSGNRTIVVRLAGTYTVGSGGDYATLTAAIADLALKGVSAATVFQLTDASYTSETLPVTIDPYINASETNTVTLRPASGVTASVSGSSASAVIVLNGCDHVTIDGSNNGSSSRDLTITNTNTSASSAVIWGQTSSGGDAATNNTVKNVTVWGSANTQTLFGIGFGGTTISTSSTGNGNNANTIQNCAIRKTRIGIYLSGASSGAKDQNNVVTRNDLSGTSPDNIRQGGILADFQNAVAITQNSVSGMFVNDATMDLFGIALGTYPPIVRTDLTPGGDGVTNATVSRNIIGTIVNAYSSGSASAAGIYLSGSTSGTTTIDNNMVAGVRRFFTTGQYVGAGIYLAPGNGSTILLYYNSISMTSPGAGTTDGESYALCIRGVSTPSSLVLKNNILINAQDHSVGASYAVGMDASSYSFLTSDYNLLSVSGPDGILARTGGLNSGSDRSTFADWKTETGKDQHSVSKNVTFTGVYDLHLSGGSVGDAELLGTPLGGFTVDADGDTRNASYPYMGADENTVTALPVTLSGFMATVQSGKVLLQWRTESEQNNASFTIERTSSSGGHSEWHSIGSVAGHGTTAVPQEYRFTDVPASGTFRYRLKQTDNDGHSSYSAEAVVTVSVPAVFMLAQNFPNPFNPATLIRFSVTESGPATLTVYDALGRTAAVLVRDRLESGKMYERQFDASLLPSGIYVARLQSGERMQVMKMLLMK